MKRIAFVLLMPLLAVLSCQPSFVILHVNDTHSHLEPEHSGPYKGMGGVIERAACVDSVRKAMGKDRTLLLHAGDFNQGTSYYSELGGKTEIDIANAMGYDCIVLGNHEFDNGIEDLAARLARLECPVVCANIDVTPFELAGYVTPYTVLKRAGRKIGIIGLTSNLKSNVSATISSRIPQFDNVEVTNKWASFLHEKEKCDMIILLSHLGYANDQDIVPATHYIDLVIGGHSHTFVDDFIYVKDADGKDVPIIQDGCFGYNVGLITVGQQASSRISARSLTGRSE